MKITERYEGFVTVRELDGTPQELADYERLRWNPFGLNPPLPPIQGPIWVGPHTGNPPPVVPYTITGSSTAKA